MRLHSSPCCGLVPPLDRQQHRLMLDLGRVNEPFQVVALASLFDGLSGIVSNQCKDIDEIAVMRCCRD